MARIAVVYPGNTLFTHEIPIRITDLNYGNHLGNDALVSILHEVRARFFQAFGMAELDIDGSGAGIILVELAVSYRSQAFFGQVLRVEVAVCDPTSRGCDLAYRITERDTGRTVALARTGLLFFDYKQGRVAAMPARFRDLVESGR